MLVDNEAELPILCFQLTPGSTQHFFHSQKQQLIQLQQKHQQQQYQQLHLHQQQLQLQKQQQEQQLSQRQYQNSDQQITAATSRSPGSASGKETAEDVIGKVHAVIRGDDRAISPLETVSGLRETSTKQAVQLQRITGGKETAEGMIKSPPVLADRYQFFINCYLTYFSIAVFLPSLPLCFMIKFYTCFILCELFDPLVVIQFLLVSSKVESKIRGLFSLTKVTPSMLCS